MLNSQAFLSSCFSLLSFPKDFFNLYSHSVHPQSALLYCSSNFTDKTNKADTLVIYLTTNSHLCGVHEKPNPSPEHP